jgi:hypothetical protein
MSIRPQTLQDVAAAGVDSLADFGRTFRDWLHALARFTSRAQVALAIQAGPASLAERFPEGSVADAWLAAYAELLAAKTHLTPPEWAFDPRRVAPAPWFAEETPALRALALARSPLPFKRRNLYTSSVELPLRLRPGRPVVSAEQKRRANAERQQRFRERRQLELAQLRALARVA